MIIDLLTGINDALIVVKKIAARGYRDEAPLGMIMATLVFCAVVDVLLKLFIHGG